MKVYSEAMLKAEKQQDNERATVLTRAILDTLPTFVSSSYLEVQERVSPLRIVIELLFHRMDAVFRHVIVVADLYSKMLSFEFAVKLCFFF